jgi:hypothetical protein
MIVPMRIDECHYPNQDTSALSSTGDFWDFVVVTRRIDKLNELLSSWIYLTFKYLPDTILNMKR